MKNLFPLLFLNLIYFNLSFAQADSISESEFPVNSDKIFNLVEVMPSWKGCESLENQTERNSCTYGKISDYLVNEIKYPENAKKSNIEGKVYINFIIDETGKVFNAKIQRSVSEELDAEALRVVNSMPDWNPGVQRGKTVKVNYMLPINFTLKKEEKGN